jgi:hypothetical protein
MSFSRKYEKYRKILRSRFLVIGRAQGHSLPADTRSSEHIHFGDATLFLGWYTGVLATEFHLLSEGLITTQTLRPQKTLRELYFALIALRRLIAAAADCFGPSSNQCPGFFIRDDVLTELKDHFAGVAGIESDYLDASPFLKEESQDQLIHLLLGLALVNKFIPPNAIIQGRPLVATAQHLAFEICSWPSTTRWIIKNPYVGNKKVDRGPYACFFSHPLVAVIKRLDERGSDLSNSVNWATKWVWKHIMRYNLGGLYNATNLHLTLTAACLSDTWGRKSLKCISRLAKKFNWPIYPMINVVLFSDIHPHKKLAIPGLRTWAGPLLEAAPRAGLSHQGSPAGWKASHRFLFDKKMQTEGRDDHVGKAFSGVDFMLLHNVYQIMRSL